MKEFIFKCEMKTRDYECDVQGVVNNANYQHYLEVTRHEFIQSVGESFDNWHRRGIDVMVSKIIINYKASLHGGEEFISYLNIKRAGVRYVFEQEIHRKSDDKLCITAEVHCVCVVDGVLTRGDEIAGAFKKYLNAQ
ncbi:MAG: acyl-CoA thioesterase [Bacteroidales bacterium]|jgi:acyl-CoA thioester hydrolase|nr:acyl-CoA thioesterase [Bacteroidales bacterium]